MNDFEKLCREYLDGEDEIERVVNKMNEIRKGMLKHASFAAASTKEQVEICAHILALILITSTKEVRKAVFKS